MNIEYILFLEIQIHLNLKYILENLNAVIFVLDSFDEKEMKMHPMERSTRDGK